MDLTGKRIAVLAEDLYQEMEVWYPIYRFREAGATVTVVGPEAKTYASKLGYPVRAERAADQVSAGDFDAVVVPGGYAPDRMRLCAPLVTLVAETFQAGKVVAAICHGLWVPCSAGILTGKTATCYVAIKDDVIHAGAEYVDRETVVDGNLITARVPDDLPAFCRAIGAALAG